jgi:hypothetical protein
VHVDQRRPRKFCTGCGQHVCFGTAGDARVDPAGDAYLGTGLVLFGGTEPVHDEADPDADHVGTVAAEHVRRAAVVDLGCPAAGAAVLHHGSAQRVGYPRRRLPGP